MQKAIIDLSKNGIIPVFHAKQGDTSRRVAITLLDNGLPYDTAADAVSVWYRGPSGEGNYSDGIDKDGSTLTILVNPNMTAASGRHTCAVMLSNESGRCTTWNFCVEVAYTPALGSEEAKAYFEAFEAGELAADIAAVDARTAKAVAELNARVSAIIASGTATEGNTELIDIRTGADGKVYQTAGDAVRGQIGELKSDLTNHSERLYNIDGDVINPKFKQGYINIIDQDPLGEAWSVVSDFVHLKRGDVVSFEGDDNLYDKRLISSSGSFTLPLTVIKDDDYKIRIFIKNQVDTITPEEATQKTKIYNPNNIANKIKENEVNIQNNTNRLTKIDGVTTLPIFRQGYISNYDSNVIMRTDYVSSDPIAIKKGNKIIVTEELTNATSELAVRFSNGYFLTIDRTLRYITIPYEDVSVRLCFKKANNIETLDPNFVKENVEFHETDCIVDKVNELIEAKTTLTVIGDSISSDIMSNNGMAWTRMVFNKLRATNLDRHTVGGAKIMAHLTDWIAQVPNSADMVIIALGINDVPRLESEEPMGDIDVIMEQDLSQVDDTTILGKYRKELETLKNRLENENACIVCIAPIYSEYDGWEHSENQWAVETYHRLVYFRNAIATMCKTLGGANNGWYYIDGSKIITKAHYDNGMYYYDTIHPNRLGECVYADGVMKYIPPIQLLKEDVVLN